MTGAGVLAGLQSQPVEVSMVNRLENQVALSARQQAVLLQFARRVLCDEGISVRAADARLAIEGAPDSFDELMVQFERAGSPFMLRAFDSRMQVSRRKCQENVGAFLLAALRTLATVCFDAVPSETEEDLEEEGFDPGHELGILSHSQIGEWDSHTDRREWTYDELTVQIAQDSGDGLELVAPGASQRGRYILAALLMELAGFAPKPDSDDPDHTRYERTRRYVRTAKGRRSRAAADGG